MPSRPQPIAWRVASALLRRRRPTPSPTMQKNARPVSEAAINSLKQLSAVFSVQSSERRCCSQYDYLPAGSQVRRLSKSWARRWIILACLVQSEGTEVLAPRLGRTLSHFLNALRFASSFSSSRGLNTMLTSLSAFRGPSARRRLLTSPHY
jgi:hypothetical protein